MGRGKSWTARYGFAFLVAVLAIATIGIPVIGPGLLGFLYFAVMLSAWYGGRGPGLFTTILILLVAVIGGRAPVSSTQVVTLATFVALGITITLLVQSLRVAKGRAEVSEKWISAIVTSIGDAVIATDEHGSVVLMNPCAQSLTGWTETDARGRHLVDVFPIINETTRNPVENPVERVLATGCIVGLANHTVLCARDGTERPIDDSAAPITNAEGQIRGVVLVFRDVTEKRRADELREHLAAIVESSDDAIASESLDGVITSWNRAAERILGYPADEIIGKHVLMLMPENEREDATAVLGQVRGGERVELYETKRRRKDGTIIDVALTVSPIKNTYGEIVGASSVARDVSDRKQAEEERKERERRKDEFLAMLAHELRNPIAAIASAASLSSPEGSREDLAWAADVINRQVRHLSHLLDDLLDVSRITRGKIRLLKQHIDARSVIDSALESVGSAIREKSHRLESSIPRDPLPLDVDPVRLEQVFVNLLTNAAKYTLPGGRIRFEAARINDEIEFRVQDNGPGIAARDIPRLFELFAQGERLPGRDDGGLGVGLTIVKSLVELHGGRVSVESRGPDTGSTFVVRLPAARVAAALPAETALPSSPSEGNLRILIVDDNRDLAQSLTRILRTRGFEAAAVFDGPEGIEAARNTRPDFLLLDIGLPTLDGLQVATILRSETELAELVIIGISGYGQEDDVKRSLEAGMNHHLVKPLDLNVLTGLLAQPRP
jgi:PAS domain S-box-containing protein